jgi:predicted O-linked N-acetylglucosamine transferase (SPINDLY family)
MNSGRARSLLFFLLLFAVAALALDASYGQGRGSGGDQQKQQMPQGQQGQMQKDMHQKSHMTQHQRHLQEYMPDNSMYGHEMMTAEERERYRRQLSSARSDREWSQLRAEHQREMQARAKAQGKQLDPPAFGQHMMTIEEQNRYTERMQSAKTDVERTRIREEHQQMMMQRARDLGIGEMLQEQ